MTTGLRQLAVIVLLLLVGSVCQAEPVSSSPYPTPDATEPKPRDDNHVNSMFFGSITPEQAVALSQQLQEIRKSDPDAALPKSLPNPGETRPPTTGDFLMEDGSVYQGPLNSSLAFYMSRMNRESREATGRLHANTRSYLGGLLNLASLFGPLAIYLDSLTASQCSTEDCILPTYGQGSTSQKGDLSILSHPGYDYVPSVMWDEGKYKMWWCSSGGTTGDRIFYSESVGTPSYPVLQNGSWSTPAAVFGPEYNVDDVDGNGTCDPSVVKVGGTYYMYYTALPHEDGCAFTYTTRIGIAVSDDGVNWEPRRRSVSPYTRIPIIGVAGCENQSECDPESACHIDLDSAYYGAGHPSVIFVDGYFYLTYNDDSGSSPGQQMALRSPDPYFQVAVEEWQLDGNGDPHWVDLNGTAPSTLHAYTPSVSVDWAYAPATKEFIVSIDGVGVIYSDSGVPYAEVVERGTHSSIRAFSKDLKTESTWSPVHVRAQWVDGPGVAKYSSGNILRDSSCSNYWIRVIRGGRDWNDPHSAPGYTPYTPTQCEQLFKGALGGHNPPATPPNEAMRQADHAEMIKCTELSYQGWDHSTGLSSCPVPTGTLVADDYDGDEISDPVVYRPSTGVWYTRRSSNGQEHGEQWGGFPQDQPIFGADYDGDRIADPAVKRDSEFYVLTSTGTCPYPFVPFVGTKGCYWSSLASTPTGTEMVSSDTPLPGDYDGDGKTDVAVQSTSNEFKIIPSNWQQTGSCPATWWNGNSPAIYVNGVRGCTAAPGGSGLKPLAADFDGDGKTDIAYHSPSTGQILTNPSSNTSCSSLGHNFTASGNTCYSTMTSTGNVPVPADYDGDGKADPVAWDPSDYHFKIWSAGTCFTSITWQYDSLLNYCRRGLGGASGDVPLAKHFNSDAHAEPTLFVPNSSSLPGFSMWRIYATNSTAPSLSVWTNIGAYVYESQWGLPGDRVEGLR